MTNITHHSPNMNADNDSLAICVVTFQRNASLDELLTSLSRLRLESIEPSNVQLIIVDNNPDLSAAPVRLAWEHRLPFGLTWVECGNGGIVEGRNAALDACGDQVHIACFVDDDETVEPGWLEAILLTFRANQDVTVVVGPVLPVFPPGSDPKLAKSGIYDRPPPAAGTILKTASTANVAFRLEPVRSLGLSFDPRMSQLGGEDHVFFSTLFKAGHKIVWNDAMVVNDHLPTSRMTLKWLTLRALRKGNTLAVGDSIVYGRWNTLARRIPRSTFRLTRGATQIAYLGLRNRSVLPGVVDLLTAVGTLGGLLGRQVVEYRRAAPHRANGPSARERGAHS